MKTPFYKKGNHGELETRNWSKNTFRLQICTHSTTGIQSFGVMLFLPFWRKKNPIVTHFIIIYDSKHESAICVDRKKLVTDGRTGRRMDGQDLLQRCVIASKNTSSVFFMWTLNWLFRGCERGFSMIILYFIRFSLVRLVGIQRINPVIALVVAFLIVLVLVSPIFLHICIDFSWIYFFPAAQKFPTET